MRGFGVLVAHRQDRAAVAALSPECDGRHDLTRDEAVCACPKHVDATDDLGCGDVAQFVLVEPA